MPAGQAAITLGRQPRHLVAAAEAGADTADSTETHNRQTRLQQAASCRPHWQHFRSWNGSQGIRREQQAALQCANGGMGEEHCR